MGGSGSGRPWGSASYDLTSDYLRLDIRTIKRERCLTPGGSYSWQWTWQRSGDKCTISFKAYADRLELAYNSHNGEAWQTLRYPVYFSKSSCHLGGGRTWFLCPGNGCNNRVAILYGDTYFLCRKCTGLVYASQRETALDRLTRRIDNTRDRLKWSQGFANGPESKPKWMHWRTYWNIRREYDQLEEQVLLKIGSIF
jgi:hypothetical protein